MNLIRAIIAVWLISWTVRLHRWARMTHPPSYEYYRRVVMRELGK